MIVYIVEGSNQYDRFSESKVCATEQIAEREKLKLENEAHWDFVFIDEYILIEN